MIELRLRAPGPDDARVWAEFLVREQQRTYAGALPTGFAARFLAAEAINEVATSFSMPGMVGSMAWRGAELVGVASSYAAPMRWEVEHDYPPPAGDRVLDKLYVTESARGSGLADRLLDAVVDNRSVYLWLIDGNQRAGRFYQRRGFRHLDESAPAGGSMSMHRMVRDSTPPPTPQASTFSDVARK